MKHKNVAIIILNWNNKRDTLECLRSVEDLRSSLEYDFDIIVVDNGSNDGSPTFLKQHFPKALYIENSANLGYAGGNNAGITEALKKGYLFVLILNNDIVVDANLLTELLSVMALDGKVGVVGAVNYYYLNRTKIQFSGGHIEWSRGNIYDITRHCEDKGQFPDYRYVDTVAGSCMLIRGEVIKRIGLFDERFFLNFEETDFCCRAQKAGYKIISCMKAYLWHKVSLSFKTNKNSNVVDYFITRNKPLFLWKNSPRKYLILSVTYHILYTFLKALRYFARGKYDGIAALVFGLGDALSGKYYTGSMAKLLNR